MNKLSTIFLFSILIACSEEREAINESNNSNKENPIELNDIYNNPPLTEGKYYTKNIIYNRTVECNNLYYPSHNKDCMQDAFFIHTGLSEYVLHKYNNDFETFCPPLELIEKLKKLNNYIGPSPFARYYHPSGIFHFYLMTKIRFRYVNSDTYDDIERIGKWEIVRRCYDNDIGYVYTNYGGNSIIDLLIGKWQCDSHYVAPPPIPSGKEKWERIVMVINADGTGYETHTNLNNPDEEYTYQFQYTAKGSDIELHILEGDMNAEFTYTLTVTSTNSTATEFCDFRDIYHKI
ncbi:hypothetical protein [uncultured Alistipes sp.]|uniref:hypothetical protein n=1 Tax=uncultured Alistipes sp. TaxID=538949 RepID=UPI002595A52D|nr:hypothetical protein [uncultured Alistipes sp.]